MLEIRDIDRFRSSLNKIEIKKKADKGLYHGKLYEHLFSLLKFDLLASRQPHDFKTFDLAEYNGLIQYALENSNKVENQQQGEINWKFIDDAKDLIRVRFKTLLGSWFLKDSRFSPMLDFTIDAIAFDLMYQMMHPSTDANPWEACEDIFEKGYLFLGSDNEDQLNVYNKHLLATVEDPYKHNLGFIAFSKTPKTESKSFTGFVVDNRLSLQNKVLNYLIEHARGVAKSKKKSRVIDYFKSQGDDYFRLPVIFQNLKKLGILGSTSQGIFYMENREDFQASYDFHQRLITGHTSTVNSIRDRARFLNIAYEDGQFY